ncbi:hypothetical protein P4N68_11515 [Corynebacterium felinum]|uniref:Major Facilitator Superfamily protein n=1 Tax=Corynebacterium felinum TaxID=131318 RepID=A0ABU2B529_9CORY|nr:MFS transporter [Corynebacterium felinum]MDF5821699.1 hypothetical protein [Corynebacterium felinum]MDR7353717.1 hypothetical protein [Corynebacterium felinum]WJY95896.1 Major Facilitator Superfamily protein [Corynebacterium felinum]
MENTSTRLARLRAVLVGNWLSALGVVFFGVAITWHLNEAVGVQKAAWIIGLVQFLPAALAIPVTVAFIDRVSKAQIVLRTDEVRILVSFVSAAVIYIYGEQRAVMLVTIIIAIACLRVADAFYTPAIRASVGSAIRSGTKYSAQFYLTVTALSVGLVAPLIVPVAAKSSVALAFVVNGVTYLAAYVCFRTAGTKLLDAESTSPRTHAVGQWWGQVKEGLRTMWNIPTLKLILPTLPMIDLCASAVMVLGPAIAGAQTAMDAVYFYALIVAVSSISQVAGPFVYKHLAQYRFDGMIIATNCCTQALAYGIAAMLIGTPYYVIPLVVVGVCVGMNQLAINELIQHECPAQALGRVFTLLPFVVLLAMPLGPLLTGYLSQFSLQVAVGAVAVALFAVGIPPLASGSIRSFQLRAPK